MLLWVMLLSSGTTPANWPLARVINVHPGQKDLVHVVKHLQETREQNRYFGSY